MGSDKMTPRHVYENPFTIRFSDRSEWNTGFQPAKKGELGIQMVRKQKRHWGWGILP
jgi:hypothetical protein